ncbi:hypothetical protein Pelo_13638 [Pelomyxa schiedti]|nr:hypothetical protein Pelo_13638 [Pelomyxa schiedti]
MSLFSITCVGCMRPLCDSISLCCGHNVCRSCVAASASAAHIMGMSKPSPDRSPEKVTVSVQCPLNCTITSNVTWSGSPSALEGEISENQTLNTFVNKQLSEMAQSILCACRIKCRKHPAQATTECTDCHDMLFCGACFQQQHDDLPKMHQSSPLDTHKEILFSAAPYCAQHPKVESSLYCKDCETAVCPTCKFCIHQEHTCVSLKDLLRDTEEEISQYIFRFKSIMKLEANALTTVDLQKMRIIKAIDAGTRVLRHSLEEMKTLIEERISWINAHGEELKRTAVSRLNLQHHSIEQVLNKQQTVASLASKSLKSKNPTARRDTQKKLETVFSESLLLKKHLEPCEKSSNISINADDTNAIKYFISHFGSIQLNSTPIVKASPVEPVSSHSNTGTCDTNKLSNATTSVPAVPSAVQTTHIPDTSQAVRDKLACDTSSRDIPALHLCKITASTFAGIGTQGFLDGSAQAAQFKFPCNLVIDSQRSLIVADQNNHRIRKISPEGMEALLSQ